MDILEFQKRWWNLKMNDRNLEIDPRGRYIFAGVKIEAMQSG